MRPNPASLPHLNHLVICFLPKKFSPHSTPFWEESLWANLRLMTRRTRVFAGFLLPYDCDLETEAEPKHNMVLIFENDFRSKLQQVWNWQTLRGLLQQGQCQKGHGSGLSSRFNLFVEPLRRFIDGCDMVWFALPNAYHRNEKKDCRC